MFTLLLEKHQKVYRKVSVSEWLDGPLSEWMGESLSKWASGWVGRLSEWTVLV